MAYSFVVYSTLLEVLMKRPVLKDVLSNPFRHRTNQAFLICTISTSLATITDTVSTGVRSSVSSICFVNGSTLA
jgi:hypothetical protein